MKKPGISPFPLYSCSISIIIICNILLATGCGPARNIQPDTDTNISRPSIQDLLDTLRQRDQAIKSLNLVFDIDYRKDRKQDRANLIALVTKPDKLYFELTGPLGALGMLSSDGNEVRIWDARNQTFHTGPAGVDMLGRLIPLEMEPGDLVSFLAVAPRPIRHDAHRIDFDAKNGSWRLVLKDKQKNRSQMFWFDLPSGDLRAVSYIEQDRLISRGSFMRWKKVKGRRLPELWKIELPERGIVLKLERRGDVILDTEYPDELFRLKPPGSR